MAKKKVQKKRGSREHGRGRKAGRGAGLRGGRGGAQRGGAKKIQTIKEKGKDYWGGHGFNRPQKVIEETVAINVGDLRRKLEDLEADGHVTYDGETPVVDLDAAGVDKLLGGGRVHQSFQVKVTQTTDKAIEKLEANGGEIELLEDENDDEGSSGSEEGAENEPSND